MQGHTKSPISLKQFVLCEAHNNELKHYCVDCSKPLCSDCIASKCRSHNTHELTAVASQNKQSLRSATQELQAQHEAINERLKQIHERISGKQPQQLKLAPRIATTVNLNHNLNHNHNPTQLAHQSTETMSSTEEARKVVVSECAKLWQAIESKKESLLTKINQQAHAKLKTLTLHKDHFEMMSSCAAQLVAQSESLTKSQSVSCCAVLCCT